MKIRLEDGQTQYIIGGNQMNTNLNSTAQYVQTQLWGDSLPGQVPNLLIATGLSYSPAYGWGNSKINFLTSTTPGSSSNILGGLQQNNNMNSSGTWVDTLNWGLSTPGSETNPTTIAAAQSYSKDYDWGNGQIQIYTTTTTTGGPWMTIVGSCQECNNLTSSGVWVTINSWGVQTGPSALIASFQAFSTEYGWGNSRVVFYFEQPEQP